MELSAFISPVVTAIIAIVGSYAAFKNANNEKLEELHVQIAELEAIGVEWWVEGADAIAEHGRDVSKANKEQEDRIAELEAAVANLAAS